MQELRLAVVKNNLGITFRFEDRTEEKSIEQRAAANDISAHGEETLIPPDEDLCRAEAEWDIMSGPEIIQLAKNS